MLAALTSHPLGRLRSMARDVASYPARSIDSRHLPMFTRLRFIRVLVSATFLSGCSDSTPSYPAHVVPAINIERAAIDTSVGTGVYLDVQMPGAAELAVVYWPAVGADSLEHLVPNVASRGRVLMARLLPDRDYRFDVSALNSAGETGNHLSGTFHTRPLPPDLASITFAVTGAATSPLTMLELNGDFRGYVVLDDAGVPVWWWRSQGGPQGWARRANGNFVFNDAGYGIFEVTPDGRLVHALDAKSAPAVAPFTHHELLATPDDHILFLAKDARVVADTILTGDAIWEWTPETGALVKHTSVFDFLDPSLDVGTHSTSSDWVHANSLSYGRRGNLILSLNWLNEVVSLAPNFGPVEWRLGGRQSSYAVATDATFRGQHSVSQLANGHILMFDNERDRTGTARASRALEIMLDGAQKTATRAWSYEPVPSVYAPYVGSARRLGNGNTLVHFGLAPGYSGATGPVSTVEVTRAGEVVSRTTITGIGGVGLSYRNEPMTSIAGERPAP
jgi:hypothetical protein